MEQMERIRRSPYLLAAIAGVLGACSANTPGVLVGETQHFRLFVDPELMPVSPGFQGSNGLTALETDWADKETMLKMPDGKIDYYWLAADHVSAACDNPESGPGFGVGSGCEWIGELKVDATTMPHQHELIHAYMDLLSNHHRPLSFVVEGTAEAIGCNTPAGSPVSFNVAWQDVVAAVPVSSPELYTEGGLFVRYLVRTQGIDAFVRYYEQAPERRDPALFAANFSSFWNMSVDDVWTAMHTPQMGDAATDAAICPCSLPALAADGQPIKDGEAVSPYWTLPDATGESIGLAAPAGDLVYLKDCAGSKPDVQGEVLLERLSSGTGLYVPYPLSTTSLGQYISDTCADAAPYQLPADLLSGLGYLTIVASRTTADSMTEYLKIQAPFMAHMLPGAAVREICDTCAFDQGSCQPVTGGAVSVQGAFYVKITFPPVSQFYPDPNTVTEVLRFMN